MRVTVTREVLEGLISATVAVVPGKATLPVLTNVLLETTENGLSIRATDLDTTIAITGAADIEAAGSITLPGKKLLDIVRDLPLASVRISATGDQRAVVECGAARFRLLAVPAGDFPVAPDIDFREKWQISGRDLQMLIAHTSFAASMEESRPILNGVLWEVRGTYKRMVATNGHRLARMEVVEQGGQDGDFIIPPRALDHVRRVFKAEDSITVGRAENHIGFRSVYSSVVSRLIEGPYPDYERVIPRDNPFSAVVDRLGLMSVLRRLTAVASDQTHRVKLAFNAAILRFSVQTPDVGDAADEMPIRYSGDPVEIGFNAAYLLEILKFLPTDDVRLTLKTGDRAVTIEPEGWNSTARYLCLLMPLRLVD